MIVWLGLLLSGPASATSLRFFGNGTGDIDRVKIKIDGPAVPADVGATDFTLEWWMRAAPDDNASEDVSCGSVDGWINGNILFDRDVFGDGDRGDYGVSLTGGRLAFGVSVGSIGNTICGTIDVTDDVWHHVAVTRRFSDGRLRIYVDGVLDAEGAGNVGPNQDVSYRDNRATAHPLSDPYLVIGAEKHDAGTEFPSYHGWIDEVRLSTGQRYTGTRFTRPFSLFTPDGSTAALYHLDEGTGNLIGDSASGGGSPGVRRFGGNPAGPAWASDGAPLESARRVALQKVISGLSRPVAMANSGDGRLFVVEADGRILAYDVNDTAPFASPDTFLDIRSLVNCCSERGLLGLAFHPNFASNGYFFVYYTRANGDVVLARYQAASAGANTVNPATAHVLLTVEHSTFSNHNGGGIAFGPDGYLYVPVGDGGGAGDPLHSGQNLGTLLGKILRLDVDVEDDPPPYYEIPPDNPFRNTPGALPEIWAWGLRNPWRIGFDRLSGDLFIADVGQDSREEVNLQLAGAPGGLNYGWPRMEGTACFNPSSGCQTGSLVLPILDYSQSEGGCSVIGGYRYRGAGLPTLNGAYVFGDYCAKKIWIGLQSASGSWSRADLIPTGFNISTFGEDSSGEIYVADLKGAIYRLARVPYGATYQASTFSATAGASLIVPVTLTNTGSLTWGANGAFRLAYHWYQGSTLVTWEGVRTTLPSTVPPGGSITLQAAVNAPTSAGAYTLKWDMIQQAVTWFSAQGVTPMAIPVTVTTGVPAYGATYQASTFGTTAGASLTVPVTLTNTGSLTWDANSPFRLSYHWYQGSTLVTWDGVRTTLPTAVPPGGSITLQAAVNAPTKAGSYTLKWDLVREFVTWFSPQGVAMKAVAVTVGPGAPPYGVTYQASAFSLKAGATVTVPVTLTNTGSLTWDGNSLFRLGYHWYQGPTLVTWEGVRTTLPSTVPPGGSITVQAVVTAPDTPGTYSLRWDLLRQTVAWFSQQGVATGNVTITVTP